MLAARRCAAQGRAARGDRPLRGPTTAAAPCRARAAPRRAAPPPRAEPPPAAEAEPAAAAAGSNNGYTADPDEPACYGTGAEVECILPEGSPADGSTAAAAPSTSARGPLSQALDAALLVSPFFFWGTSMVAMKQLGPVTTPLALASWRLVPAGGALLLWAAATGRRAPAGAAAWAAIALFALADGAAFQGCLALGLQRTSAGLGSVIIDSQPLTVAVLAALLFGERLGAAGAAGLAAGVAGLALLEVPPDALAALLHGAPLGDGVAASSAAAAIGTVAIDAAPPAAPWSLWDSGEWWMLLAAQSMAVGTVMVRWVARFCDPVVATGWHMVLGGIPLAILAAYYEGPELILGRLAAATPLDGVLLAYVTLLGSAASYGVFFYEATTRGNLTALSSLTFLTPVFAAAGGYLALGETLAPAQLAGAAVTLGGVALLNAPKRERRAEAEARRREE